MILTDDEFVRHVQTRLKTAGLLKGVVDGAPGPLTMKALDKALPPPQRLALAPWITAATEVMGLHESRDNAELRAWLKRDGRTLGNPGSLPWCGDFCATAMRIGLPDEEMPGPVGENPYWAKNWIHFGRRLSDPMLHSVVVFTRDGGGHVGFAIGQDAKDLYVLGGNQANEVNVSRISKSRLIGSRWPKTWPYEPAPLPAMTPGSIPRTMNEF